MKRALYLRAFAGSAGTFLPASYAASGEKQAFKSFAAHAFSSMASAPLVFGALSTFDHHAILDDTAVPGSRVAAKMTADQIAAVAGLLEQLDAVLDAKNHVAAPASR